MADKVSITICGDGGCGKSSITLRLVRSQWIHEYDPTIEDSYSVTRNIDGTDYFLSITDTAGQEEYRGLWASSNLKSDAFLLVYDITNQPSLEALDYFMDMIDIETEQRFEDTQRLLEESRDNNSYNSNNYNNNNNGQGLQVGMPPPVKIVAGNKCDLKEGRVVPARDGLEYARKHGCGFMETSAREMVNIEETFALIVRRVIEARRQHYLAQNQPPPRMGSSTARTPALSVGDQNTSSSSARQSSSKSSRWNFLGRSKTATTKTATISETDEDEKFTSQKMPASKKESRSWWRRILCL
ncbi:uncharacterized protein TRUGW13939_11598 [Talaromyces rugulosus]|uniref:Uncharacterized protein n=1 Tax=Talaromyces rugulosus TaxID=121627 RepID=A0A7H8RDC0_TALRU|nr:uncharacterized protein TRUGW13939_11598 [Talaromyces rugulosus]QKX64424.1 hypothetical protein TRUGW13939_11598 [Talaromyces rugulosus]